MLLCVILSRRLTQEINLWQSSADKPLRMRLAFSSSKVQLLLLWSQAAEDVISLPFVELSAGQRRAEAVSRESVFQLRVSIFNQLCEVRVIVSAVSEALHMLNGVLHLMD